VELAGPGGQSDATADSAAGISKGDPSQKEQDMVPGMAERDREIANSQRLDWLADALLGTSHRCAPSLRDAGEAIPGLWQVALQQRRTVPRFRDLGACVRNLHIAPLWRPATRESEAAR
jgi:hypothetical protein